MRLAEARFWGRTTMWTRAAILVVTVSVVLALACTATRSRRAHQVARFELGRTSGGAGNPFTGARYDAAHSLPTLPDKARAYRLRTGTTFDANRIAATFGIHAAVRHEGAELVADDGSHRLRLSGSGWTIGPSAETGGSNDVHAGCLRPSGDANPGDCPPTAGAPPTTTPGSTSVDTTLQVRARDLLSRAGMKLAGATVAVDDEVSTRRVRFSPVLAGMPTVGMSARVSFERDGAIDAASGVDRGRARSR
jgi:hypothetical protein